jgi:hypothetical protein
MLVRVSAPLLNGKADPDPLELRAGVTYRFRLVNIRSASNRVTG